MTKRERTKVYVNDADEPIAVDLRLTFDEFAALRRVFRIVNGATGARRPLLDLSQLGDPGSGRCFAQPEETT